MLERYRALNSYKCDFYSKTHFVFLLHYKTVSTPMTLSFNFFLSFFNQSIPTT